MLSSMTVWKLEASSMTGSAVVKLRENTQTVYTLTKDQGYWFCLGGDVKDMLKQAGAGVQM